MMTGCSFGFRFFTYLAASLGFLVWSYGASVMAQPSAPAVPPRDALLSFFPDKPLAVVRVPSFRMILEDIESLVQRVGYGAPATMFREQGFRAVQAMVGSSTPIESWSQLLRALGAGPDLSFAVAAVRIPTPPHVGAVVVISVENSAVLTQLLTDKIPANMDGDKWKRCSRHHQRLQSVLQNMVAANAQQAYTLQDVLARTRGRMKRMCPAGVVFRVEGNRIVSPDLEKGLPGFRQRWGTTVQTKPISKWATLFTLDKLTYALVAGRYLVWASHPPLLQQALQTYRSDKTGQYLTTGFHKHLGANSRFQMYLNYQEYIDVVSKMDQLMQQLGGNAAAQPFNLPQIKQLQQQALVLAKGYDGMWMDAHVKNNSYSLSSVVTVTDQRSPLVDLFLQAKPTQIKSLAMLPQSTVAVISMNLVRTLLNFASMMMKTMNDPSLQQVSFFVNQWQSLLGDELTLAFASSPQRPIQGIFMLEIQQAQQVLQMLMSLTAMLGGGDQSPLKTETYQNVQINYLFRPQGQARGKSPADRLPPGELAFAIVDNFFVVTYQMTNTPNLHTIKRIINPTLRTQTSLLKNAVMSSILRRLQSTNALFYLSIPHIVATVQQLAPPLPQVAQAIQVAKAFQYLFASFRNEPQKNIMSGLSEMGLTPPTATPPTK